MMSKESPQREHFSLPNPAGVYYGMQQGELFSEAAARRKSAFAVPGFSIQHDYITSEEERSLLWHVENGPWENDWRRRIQQYGVGYSSGDGKPIWVRDFPQWLLHLAGRVGKDAGFERFPENCVINEYIPPLGIGPHRDYEAFGPTVACVSLGSDIVMGLRHPERRERVSIHVPARSLWVMSGEARSEWQHSIAARLTDVIAGGRRPRSRRMSITFRTAKNSGAAPPHHGVESQPLPACEKLLDRR